MTTTTRVRRQVVRGHDLHVRLRDTQRTEHPVESYGGSTRPSAPRTARSPTRRPPGVRRGLHQADRGLPLAGLGTSSIRDARRDQLVELPGLLPDRRRRLQRERHELVGRQQRHQHQRPPGRPSVRRGGFPTYNGFMGTQYYAAYFGFAYTYSSRYDNYYFQVGDNQRVAAMDNGLVFTASTTSTGSASSSTSINYGGCVRTTYYAYPTSRRRSSSSTRTWAATCRPSRTPAGREPATRSSRA